VLFIPAITSIAEVIKYGYYFTQIQAFCFTVHANIYLYKSILVRQCSAQLNLPKCGFVFSHNSDLKLSTVFFAVDVFKMSYIICMLLNWPNA
jgi:hypothetical protein